MATQTYELCTITFADGSTASHPATSQITLADEVRARLAYAAYGEVTHFKNFRGEDMPAWEKLPTQTQAAWIAAARTAKELP